MGTSNDTTRDDTLRNKATMETRKQSGSHSSLITHRVLHKVSNSRTQLFLLFSIIFYMTNHLELFKHATSSLVTNVRM